MIDENKLLNWLSSLVHQTKIKSLHSLASDVFFDSGKGMNNETLDNVNRYIETIIDNLKEDIESGIFDK